MFKRGDLLKAKSNYYAITDTRGVYEFIEDRSPKILIRVLIHELNVVGNIFDVTAADFEKLSEEEERGWRMAIKVKQV